MAHRKKIRSLHSFLLSLNAHIWGIGLLSLVLVDSRPEPRPQRIEIQLLKLPAPAEGAEASAGISPRRTSADRRGDRPAAAMHPAGEREQPMKKRGPRVTHRVRIANSASPLEVSAPGTWTPASPLRVPRSAVQAHGSRISGVSPEASAQAVRRVQANGRAAPATQRGSPAIAIDPLSPDEAIGGDTRPLIEIIQARIDSVTPLAHATAGPCQTQKGVVRLRFVVNPAGYPCGYRIIVSSGVHCLDDEVDNVLHMAEPYPYVAGWIPVTVRFAPRTRI